MLLRIQKQNNQALLCIVILFVTVITTDTVYMGTNLNVLFQKIPQILLAGITVLLLLFSCLIGKTFRAERLAFLLVLNLCIVTTAACFVDFRTGYLFKCILVTFSFFVTQLFDLKTFAQIFNKVIVFLAAVSLFCFAAEAVNHNVFSFAPRIYNSVGYGFRNLFLYVQSDEGFALRNYGIYREPGVYQMFLIVALIFELYCFERPHLKRMVVYITTLLTTLSSTGLIALGIWGLLAYVKRNTISKKVKVGMVFLGGLIFILVISLFPSICIELAQKVFGKFSLENESFLARWGSIVLNLKMWLEHPVFGVGMTNAGPLYEQESVQVFGTLIRDNTNTLLVQFAVHGTIFGLLWLSGFIKGARALGKTQMERCLIFLIVGILSIGENVTFSPFGNVLMMYGLMYFNSNGTVGNEENPDE